MGAIDKELVTAEVLVAVEAGSSERDALKKTSKKYKIMNWRIRGTMHLIVLETIKRLNIIDLIIGNSLDKGSIDKLYPFVRNLLRVGVYLMKFAGESPPKITKTIVKLVKERFGNSIASFSNAVLRKIEFIELSSLITESNDSLNLSLQYYHPPWFIEYLINLIGLSDTIAFLKHSKENRGFYVRINALKTDLASVSARLENDGYIFSIDNDLNDVVFITEWELPIIHSSLLKQGYIYIQDKASTLVSHVVNPQDEEIIFDLCAAPGGKSMHLGELLKNSGQIISIDRSSRRLKEMVSKLSVHEIYNINVINGKGEESPDFVKYQADKILVDPPCSGTGTFASRPYGKWKLQLESTEILSKIQWKLLLAARKLLKPSGEIIYSTCSVLLEENEQIIQKFLKVFPNFSLSPTNPMIGTPGYLGLNKTQRLWPHLHNTEGFFIAKLRRDHT